MQRSIGEGREYEWMGMEGEERREEREGKRRKNEGGTDRRDKTGEVHTGTFFFHFKALSRMIGLPLLLRSNEATDDPRCYVVRILADNRVRPRPHMPMTRCLFVLSRGSYVNTRNSSGDEIANLNFLRRHLQPLLRSAPGSYRIR